MSARVRGMDLGVTPDDPEPEQYEHGQIVVWHNQGLDHEVVFIERDPDGFIEIAPVDGGVGWVVSEREVSPR